MTAISTTGTLTAGSSKTFNLAPGSALSLTLSPNVRVTITETPESVSGSGVGGNTTRVHEPQLPGTFAYGPYAMGGGVVVAVASNSGSSVAWTRKDTVVTTDSTGTSLVSGDGTAIDLSQPAERAVPLFRWVTGDLGTATAVATATPVTSDPIDMHTSVDGSFCFVHTGGSLAISYETSADGVVWNIGGPIQGATAAGTAMFNLSTLAPARFARFKLTASGSTANVLGFLMATSASASLAYRRVQRGLFGDGSAAIAMASGGTIVSPPIDLRRCIRAQSVLRIVVASGTVKVSASVSRDGYSNQFSLGDLATGLTAGIHTVQIGNLTQYGHFATFTLTETAATTASASGVASLAYADDFADTPEPRRVAVVAPRLAFSGADWDNTYDVGVMSMYAMIERLGFDAEILPLDEASSIFDDGALRYEFLVFPITHHGGLWTTWTSGAGKPVSRALKGQTKMPVFAVGVTSSANAVLLANIGANARDTEASRKILWGSTPWYAPNCGAYTVTVQAHMTGTQNFITDSTGASGVGWRFTGAAGPVYVTSSFNGGGDGNLFPLAYAEAINRGDVAVPPNKLACVIDIDDMPDCGGGGGNGTQTVADMDRVYAAQQRLNMPCSYGIRPEDITAGRYPSGMAAWIAARLPSKGGLLYPIAHSGNWMWKDGTKATKDTTYRSDIATISAATIAVGSDSSQLDAWGYMYFNNNALDAETLQLGQSLESYTSSTDNLTRKAGYGWEVARLDAINGTNTESPGEPAEVFGECWHRGIRLVASHNHIGSANKTIDFDDGSTGSDLIGIHCSRLIRYTMARGMPFYIHGSNCYDGHDSGNAPGTRWLEMLAGLHSAGLTNVVEYVHGSALAE